MNEINKSFDWSRFRFLSFNFKKLDQFHQQFHLCNLLLSNIIKPLICMTSSVSLEKLAKHKLMTILIKNVRVKKTFAGTDQTT